MATPILGHWLCDQDDFNNHLDSISSNMAEYNKLLTGRIQVFIDLWSGVFIRLTGDILEISIFMQTNDSNDAPPIVGTSYAPINHQIHRPSSQLSPLKP
jgi:hypothetical protein